VEGPQSCALVSPLASSSLLLTERSQTEATCIPECRDWDIGNDNSTAQVTMSPQIFGLLPVSRTPIVAGQRSPFDDETSAYSLAPLTVGPKGIVIGLTASEGGS
jgi:hypothetical protein